MKTITVTEHEFCNLWAKALIEYLNRGSDDIYITKDLIKLGSIMAEQLFKEERG